jgi:hypothetical protein
MLASKETFYSLLALIVILSEMGCGGSVWDFNALSPSTALTKQRAYEIEYETVFKAAYQAARQTGLYVRNLDKEMGAILASKPIGAPSSGWADGYVIYLKPEGDNRTNVQVKYQPVREGAVYTPLSSPKSTQSFSFVRTDWQNSAMKVNSLFSQIQRELRIEDILGIRGLRE